MKPRPYEDRIDEDGVGGQSAVLKYLLDRKMPRSRVGWWRMARCVLVSHHALHRQGWPWWVRAIYELHGDHENARQQRRREAEKAAREAEIKRAKAAKKQGAIYRHFDAGGALLYIGMSVGPSSRQREHAQTASHWPLVARVEIERFPSAAAARRAEAVAIANEKPRFNIAKPLP